VTTHSPYVCGQTSILKFRHFSKENGETSVTSIEDNASSRGTLSEDDIRRIDRMVINTRGELLFARGLLLFEGDTEEQALPGLAGLHWKRHVNELGFTFLGVGGHGNYRPFLVLANRFGIPWRILSDGEPEAIKSVEAALAAEKLAGGVKHPNVVIIPKGMNFEQFIASNVPRAVLEAMIVAANESGNPRHKEALTKEWNGKSMAEIVDELVGDKTKYGSMLSRFIEQHGTPIPKLFTDVFDSMEPPPAVESVAEERP
jgi:putative ATP-dependent endonuclease of OLD family